MENTEATSKLIKQSERTLFNPRTRIGRGTRLSRRHLDRPQRFWRSFRAVPASGEIEVTSSAPAAPDRGTIAATSALRVPDPNAGRSAVMTASSDFYRHERFPALGADRQYAPPRICRRTSWVFAVGRCRCASSDRTRCTAAGLTCYRAARRNRYRYRSNARPRRRCRRSAGSGYQSTSCH